MNTPPKSLWVAAISLFPEMFSALNSGITGRAQERGILNLTHWNPRDFSQDPRRRVDERPYGGGPGMVMSYQPLADALKAARLAAPKPARVIYLSPQGKPLKQGDLPTIMAHESLILLCGRYEGIDQRLIELEVDEEWSIGDYVISGGELAAMVLIDAACRLLPEALGNEDSAEQESFTTGLLDWPHYTRPENIGRLRVPEILQSGNHQTIKRWRMKQALGRTWQRRPELLAALSLTREQQDLLEEYRNDIEIGNAS